MASSLSVTDTDVPEGHQQCVLCCDSIIIFAIGACDHAICYKCSSRMRVLADQKYCAVCRTDLPQVVFTMKLVPFSEIKLKGMSGNRNYGIRFQNKQCSSKFNELLEALCPLCDNHMAFRSLTDLRTHVRKEHGRQYCDICLENLHIFPREFEVYNRQELVRHRKSGDIKNTSYKGHPLCEFCDERYFDKDELLLHLRKNHFWCHFCENDGKQEYYANYNNLREHFLCDHFLCEENNCKFEKYTSVFRTKIDLQAHKLAQHGSKLSKAAAKQARQVDIDIDFGSRHQRKGKRACSNPPEGVEVRGAEAKPTNSDTIVDKKRSSGRSSPGSTKMAAAASNDHQQINVISALHNTNHNSQQAVTVENKTTEGATQLSTSLNLVQTAAVYPPLQSSSEGNGVSNAGKPSSAIKNGNWSSLGQAPSALSEAAFPSLSSLQAVTSKQAKPPPGFANVVKRSEPPGLSGSGVRSRTQDNQIQTQRPSEKVESANKPVPSSVPPGFTSYKDSDSLCTSQKRNQLLINTISSFMPSEDFAIFKSISGQYRKGEMNGNEYFSRIQILLGNNLNTVFSELVDLLPDTQKQSELLTLYNDLKIKTDTRQGGGKKAKKKANQDRGQVNGSHSSGFDSDFPALPQTSKNRNGSAQGMNSRPASNAWVKGK